MYRGTANSSTAHHPAPTYIWAMSQATGASASMLMYAPPAERKSFAVAGHALIETKMAVSRMLSEKHDEAAATVSP